MQIILLESVEKLGKIGDIVTVKTGYARNYLLPKKKALRATDANKTYFEAQRKELEARNKTQIAEAEKVAARAKNVKIVLLRQASESGQLYGSVTARNIARALRDQGMKEVRRGNVILDAPIKELGIAHVHIRLHAEVVFDVTVNTARSAEEAEAQVVEAKKLFESEELAKAAEKALADQVPEEEEEAEDATPKDAKAAEGEKEKPAKQNAKKAKADDKPAKKEAPGEKKAKNTPAKEAESDEKPVKKAKPKKK